jgi:type VI protein secretion system component VasF
VAALSAATSAGFVFLRAQSSPAQTAAPQSAANPASNQQNVQAAAAPIAARGSAANEPAPAAGSPKQQLASEAADLLKLATSLKTEVDKSTKDTLSMGVVRKANQIEQLAHKARTGSGKG